MQSSILFSLSLALLVATNAAPAFAREKPSHRCPPPVSQAQASRELDEANQAIRKAGEHPGTADLNEILPRLRRAAYAGLREAQYRYGMYVVGYYYTDELFWPTDPEIAISALAMLRIAALATPSPTDKLLIVMAMKSPAFTDPDGPPPLPRKWLRAALAEAKRFLACQQRSAGKPTER